MFLLFYYFYLSELFSFCADISGNFCYKPWAFTAMYPSRPSGPPRGMQPPQQIDPSLANQQNQAFYPYPPAGPFIQGLSSPSGSESVGTPSDTSFNLKRSSSVVGNNEGSSSGNKRPRKDDGKEHGIEKEPKAKSTRGSRCVCRV
jgi:hypothetical protein